MPNDLLEWLALMQHHGAPTRLQDWTRSPYVAAYFAIEDSTEPNGASAVWAIDIEWCKSNVVKQIRKVKIDVGGAVQLSSDFGRAPLFDGIVMTNRAAMVLPVAPTRMNERLSIQQGLFLCPGRIQDSFMDNLVAYGDTSLRQKLLKIVIPSRFRVNALQDLATMNITRTSLFPGLDGFSQSLKYKLAIVAGSPQVRDKLERGLAEGFLYL
jgi:hypothetical protein